MTGDLDFFRHGFFQSGIIGGKAFAQLVEHVVHLLSENGSDAFVVLCLERGAAFGLGHLGEQDFFVGHAAQIADQSELFQCPDGPLGRVEVGALHAVAVVVLELVVIVVVALAEGEERHDGAVARAAAGRVRPVADGVAHRVDEECAVLHGKNTEDAGQEEAAEGAGRAVPKEAE